MNFNSILIGSADPQRLVDYYSKLFGEPAMSDGGYTGWQLGHGLGDGRAARPRSRAITLQPGRIIWNIETRRRAGRVRRFKAAGATVVAEPYSFEGCCPDLDRDTRRPRRQLLPARDPDGALNEGTIRPHGFEFAREDF